LRGGADYVVAPGLVAGVMIQHDRSDESGPGGERGGDGRGWMAGPYAGLRLSPNLMLDVRLLAGRSRNQIDPLGAYTDTFETTRWLAAARLSGMWRAGAWSFRPSAELAWLQERQAAYVSVPGIGIDAQSIALGRVTAGPEIAYAIRLQPALTLEPFAGIKALYDFAHPDVATVGGLPVQHDALRGRVEAGATLRSDGGFTFQATASWDGLGDDRMRAWQGRAAVVLPLQ
jgi:outer membrane autotransporter protein